MKVKVLSRNPDDYLRETKQDIFKMPRNFDPALHPFEEAREYTRALNAVKLDRVFAKPFVGSLDGHLDGVYAMSKHPKRLPLVVSGSYDGELRTWNLTDRRCLQNLQAHHGYVRGICFDGDGKNCYTCGDDKIVRSWAFEEMSVGCVKLVERQSIVCDDTLASIDHHRKKAMFATSGPVVNIYDASRSEPMKAFRWGSDTISRVRFNPIETDLLAGCASDRSILLYDMRGQTPLRKVVLKLRSNSICWNPIEAFVFTVANDDYNLYTFDMRRLDMALNVHMGHVSAVMDVDYSPTGQEFATAGYDKTVRIFQVSHGRSRDVYHTKRMQRVLTVLWSADAKYILSGSDEMNIRVWKANASEKLGLLKPREKLAMSYNARLKERFANHTQVKRIARHRHLPKQIYSQEKELRIIRESQQRKERNRRAHSAPGIVPYVSERKKPILKEHE